jgi:hypothetical protein
MTQAKNFAATNQAQITKCTVLEVDSSNTALVRLVTGQHVRIRADMLRGKSIAPQPGETWIIDQPYGSGWMFAVCMGYTGGDRDFTVPVLGTGWTDAGTPYQPVGYIKDADGWVSLRGRLKAGTGTDAVAFTLPAGYLPGGTVLYRVPVGSGSSGTLTVEANGDVTPGGSLDTSLEQVRFLAEG